MKLDTVNLNEVNDERRRGSPPGGVLWYSLGSMGTYSTWEGDISDHISRGEKLMDDGGMSG